MNNVEYQLKMQYGNKIVVRHDVSLERTKLFARTFCEPQGIAYHIIKVECIA